MLYYNHILNEPFFLQFYILTSCGKSYRAIKISDWFLPEVDAKEGLLTGEWVSLLVTIHTVSISVSASL